MKPLTTIIRKSLAHALREYEPLVRLLGNRIFAGRVEAWASGEFPALSVYREGEDPVPEENHPAKDERKLDFVVEVIAQADFDLEDILEEIAFEVQRVLTLKPLSNFLKKEGYPDVLLSITWTGESTGLIDGGELTAGALIMNFEIEYEVPAEFMVPGSEIPAIDYQINQTFDEGQSGWEISPADPGLEAEDFLKMEEE